MSGKASRCLTCGEWINVDAPWRHWCRGNTDAELTALRQQVADLRAALMPFAGQKTRSDTDGSYYVGDDECVYRARAVLAATQPQEVQP